MIVPTYYDDDAERLRTHPILLPKEDDSKTSSTADKNVLKKTTDDISFAPDISSLNEHYLDQMCQELITNKTQNRSWCDSKWLTQSRHRWRTAGVCLETNYHGLPSTEDT